MMTVAFNANTWKVEVKAGSLRLASLFSKLGAGLGYMSSYLTNKTRKLLE